MQFYTSPHIIINTNEIYEEFSCSSITLSSICMVVVDTQAYNMYMYNIYIHKPSLSTWYRDSAIKCYAVNNTNKLGLLQTSK